MKTLLQIICILSALNVSAQNSDKQASQVIKAAVDSVGVPSMSAAVYRDGKLVFDFAYGIQDIQSKISVINTDPYHIGSITKSMTALAIANLVEEKKLMWETRIIDIFPELDTLNTEYTNANLIDLLSHSSGIVDLFSAEDWRSMPYDTTNIYDQRIQLMVDALIQKNNVTARFDWAYANVNYTIAALMAQKVTGLSWKGLMNKYIANQIDMEIGFGWAQDNDDMTVPKGHVKLTDDYEIWGPKHLHKIPITIQPAGDIYMRVSDLAKYGSFHIRGLNQGTENISQENFNTLHKGILENYALGWNILPDGTKSLPGILQHQHLGSGGTFQAVLAIFPENDTSIAIIHNGGGNMAAIGYALRGLGRLFVEE